MSEEVEIPVERKTRKPKTAIAILLAIVCACWAYFEHHRADIQGSALANAQQESAALQKQLATLQTQLAASTAKLNELAKRTLPVTVLFRRATSGTGMVGYFKNNSAAPIEISLVLTNPTTGTHREANLTISSNGFQEIGAAQGWTFAPGQRVQLTNVQFGTVEYLVPSP